MAKEQNSQSVLTFGLYVALMLVLAVFSRTAVSSAFGVVRQLMRTLLYVTSWPLYLGLLPVRAVMFFASTSMKVMFYGAMAALLYFALCGALNVGALVDNFGAAMDMFGAIQRFL